MQTAKLFKSGRSQAVRLPKECRFEGVEVGIKRLGDVVVLYPASRADELFYSSIGGFTDDYYESVESLRGESLPESNREGL
ncbi:MAG: AbrB/MazE/SpoVT family DNA-binding domain-containing protein [Clostridiales Family XIII bacterium]|jgi:antitoxin VapB|nr:AbrB/MazE/SpoVT family DNA-binding domain-containing protein [Clostridiales Family XIII bacterium]